MAKKPKYVVVFGNYNTPTKHEFAKKSGAVAKVKSLKERYPHIKIKVKKQKAIG
jgi:hypothetical protein